MIYHKIIQTSDGFETRADKLSTNDILNIFDDEFSSTFIAIKQAGTCRYTGRDDLWTASFSCLKFLGVNAKGIGMDRATGCGHSMHEAIRRCFMRYLFMCDKSPQQSNNLDDYFS